MSDQFLYAILNTVLSVIGIICIGLFIEFIQSLIARLLSRLYGVNFANLFLNRLTFIGVMHHELAHALLAFITGAKITEIHLFKPKEDGSLGSVSYAPRGPLVLRCLQITLSSMAPTLLGFVSIFLVFYFGPFQNIFVNILIGFLLLCIILHMNMSTQDIKVLLKGLWMCMIIAFVVFYYSKFNLFGFITDFLVNLILGR